MKASANEASKPLQLVNLAAIYTNRLVTSSSPAERNEEGDLILSEYNSFDRYDVVRSANEKMRVSFFPDGQPVLAAADLPCLFKLTSNAPKDLLDARLTARDSLDNMDDLDNANTKNILDTRGRQKTLELQQPVRIPVFLPPLQVGTNFLDPQQISSNYSPEAVYKMQTQARFLVGPGNSSCVNCNLRLFPFNLMSGFGPISTAEGEKPFLYPQIVKEKFIYAPTTGILPNGNINPSYGSKKVFKSKDEVFVRDIRTTPKKSKVVQEFMKNELYKFAVRNIPTPPAIPHHTIVYESDPNGCDTPKSVGFSHGNLVERGMSVTGTYSVLRYAVSSSPVLTPFDFRLRVRPVV